jgi:hypothetical protein
MRYLALGGDADHEHARPVTIDAHMILGVDARYGRRAAAQRLPLAAMAVNAMVAVWPRDTPPTAADLAAYTDTPVHEMDQWLALLVDAGYLESVPA